MDRNEPIDGRCNARGRSGPCRNYPITGRTRCRKHGGATPRGLASPHFKTGEYSGYLPHLPPGMANDYTQAANDPDLVSLTKELKLNQSFIIDVLKRLQDGDAALPKWKDAQAIFAEFERCKTKKDFAGMAAAEQKLSTILATGAGVADLREELREILNLHQRLVATDSRRLKDREELVQRAEFARFAKHVLLVVANYVIDRKTKGKIQEDVMRLLGVAAPPVILEGK